MKVSNEIMFMLLQECPKCKSTVGDIISDLPIICNGKMETEIACENCGYTVHIFSKITDVVDRKEEQ